MGLSEFQKILDNPPAGALALVGNEGLDPGSSTFEWPQNVLSSPFPRY